jgi:hypothetical protein
VISSSFTFVAAALNLAGGASYLRATLNGTIRPHRITWLLWAAPPLIVFGAQVTSGVGIQALLALSIGLVPLLVFLAALRQKGEPWPLGVGDYLCGALSLLAVALWAVTSNADLAILLSIVADLLAGLPTLAKAYTAPDSENQTIFVCTCLGAAIVLATIDRWSFAEAAFPLWIFLFTLVFVAVLRIRRATEADASGSPS